MRKVYIVTSGDCSSYGIEKVLTSRKAAEKYCAIHSEIHGDEPTIEEWDVSDGKEIECKEIHRAIFFIMNNNGRIHNISMKYSIEPFKLDICKDRRETWCNIRGISGYIPMNKKIKDIEEAKKIVYDHVAKWKAEQAGL